MLEFLKRWFGKREEGQEAFDQILKENVKKDALMTDETSDNRTKKHVDFHLSLHPDWIAEMGNSQRYMLSVILQEMNPLYQGQLAITGFHLETHPKGLLVSAFIRNGLNHPVEFKNLVLALYAKKGRLLAETNFNMKTFGRLDPGEARPWNFLFTEKDYLVKEADLSEWNLLPSYKENGTRLHSQLDILQDELESLNEKQLERLSTLAESKLPIQSGHLYVDAIDFQWVEDNGLHVFFFICNGKSIDVQLSSLRLRLKIGSKVVSEDVFPFNRRLKVNSLVPWSVIFSTSDELKSIESGEEWSLELV